MIRFFKARTPKTEDAKATKTKLRVDAVIAPEVDDTVDVDREVQPADEVQPAEKSVTSDKSSGDTASTLENSTHLAYIIALQTAGDEGSVGEHLGYEAVSDTLGVHTFAANLKAYQGWVWSVTLSLLDEDERISVLESALVPGATALLAPKWVEFKDRLKPADISETDELPYEKDDDRLAVFQKLTSGTAEALENLALERNRVLSAYGKEDLAARWYEGAHGPFTASTRIATAQCMSCAFYIPLAGDLGQLFGACANSWSRDDGRIVSADHGCGMHSETDAKSTKRWKPADSVIDQLDNVDVIQTD